MRSARRSRVVELSDGLMPGTDRDLVRPLQKRIEKRYERIMLSTRVATLEPRAGGLHATFEGPDVHRQPQEFDRVLVAVGRSANGNAINAAAAGVAVDARGIIGVDRQMRTNVAAYLCHRRHRRSADARAQGHARGQGGRRGGRRAQVRLSTRAASPRSLTPIPRLPGSASTKPKRRRAASSYGKGMFPWAASGRSLAINRDEGFTKILFDQATKRVIGGGIVGTNAGELIAEVGLAIEMGADAADVGLTIHAHPTLSETVAFSAEAFEGTLTDLYIPKR